MPNVDRKFAFLEQDILDNIKERKVVEGMPKLPTAPEIIKAKMYTELEMLKEARNAPNDSISQIENVSVEHTTEVNLLGNGASQGMQRTIGARDGLPNMTPPAPQPMPESTNHQYYGESAFDTKPNSRGLWDTMSDAAYSSTFILIGASILVVMTFLVSYMIFTYLGM